MGLILKIFLFFLLSLSSLHASGYSDTLLRIQSNIIPKMVLMDYNYKNKLQNGAIVITVLYDKKDRETAKKIQKIILNKYGKGIMNNPVKVKLINCDDFVKQKPKTTLLYILRMTPEKLKKVCNRGQEKNYIIFSYDKALLAYGANLSISVGKKVKPIINMASLKENNISFRPAMIAISEIFDE